MLAGKQDNIVTSDLYFTPSEQTDNSVTMTANAQNGGQIALKYRLGKDYLLSMSVETKGLANVFAPSPRLMFLTQHMKRHVPSQTQVVTTRIL